MAIGINKSKKKEAHRPLPSCLNWHRAKAKWSLSHRVFSLSATSTSSDRVQLYLLSFARFTDILVATVECKAPNCSLQNIMMRVFFFFSAIIDVLGWIFVSTWLQKYSNNTSNWTPCGHFWHVHRSFQGTHSNCYLPQVQYPLRHITSWNSAP